MTSELKCHRHLTFMAFSRDTEIDELQSCLIRFILTYSVYIIHATRQAQDILKSRPLI